MADPIKDYYLNQYAGATSGLNQPVTMTDSPIYQAGLGKWDPTSAASLYAQAAMAGQNLYSKLSGSDKVTHGLAGLGSGAAFRQMPENPTGIEQLKFADVFGHEMSHLGWDYKPRGERINVPGVGKEGTKASAVRAGLGDPGDPNKYLGEEQWNYMHDLMYGPRKEYSSDFGNLTYKEDIDTLQKKLGSGTITPSVFRAEASNILDKAGEPTYTPGYNYLTARGLINPGDLSYTPKAYNEIAWSGLTTPSKRAIGFGINPFEDTRAAGQFYQQQLPQRKKNQMLAWQRMKQKQMAPPGVFPGGYVSAADVAKKKAITTGGPPSILSRPTPPTGTGGPPSVFTPPPPPDPPGGPPSILSRPTPPTGTGGPPSLLTPPTTAVTTGGPPSILSRPSPPTGTGGPPSIISRPPPSAPTRTGGPPSQGGGGGGPPSRGGGSPRGGSSRGGGRNPWGRADGGLINFYRYGGFI